MYNLATIFITYVQLLPFMPSVDGFRSMTVGRSLWVLIIIKVAILFLVFKLFFFRDELATRYDTDTERADAVRQELVNRSAGADMPPPPPEHR